MGKSIFQIVVSGGIAVGKTTLSNKLGKLLFNSLTFIEQPETNPFIEDFYLDMKKWAFHL